MFYNPVILDPEYVHDSHSPVSGVADEVTMYNHEISFGDESLEIKKEFGKCPGKTLYECDKCMGPIRCPGVVLPIVGPEVFCRRFFRFF